jgi:hypothetical protein
MASMGPAADLLEYVAAGAHGLHMHLVAALLPQVGCQLVQLLPGLLFHFCYHGAPRRPAIGAAYPASCPAAHASASAAPVS